MVPCFPGYGVPGCRPGKCIICKRYNSNFMKYQIGLTQYKKTIKYIRDVTGMWGGGQAVGRKKRMA